MNVVSSRPVRSAIIKAEEQRTAASIGDINFYNQVPNFELSLDDFEEFALARLKVLRKIEEMKVRNITGDTYRIQLDNALKSQFKSDADTDLASHFILRAAYCRTEELRRWFLVQEGHLFRYRLEQIMKKPTALEAFLKKSHITLNQVSPETKEGLKTELLSMPHTTLGEFTSTPYYAIPFVEALDLIASRSCFVKGGLAYVPLSKVVSILSSKFRMALSKSLVLASQAFGQVAEESQRIAPLLKNMNSQYTGGNRFTDQTDQNFDELKASNIDQYATTSMPLCMSQLHTGLKRDHKLKHWGRLQYGLFLKGAGMSMEESLLFFQGEFSKIMSSEQFHKNYSYNIRHMYGKEGKRASYTPYNCTKIIMGQGPQSGDHHGCPYRHYDETHLGSLLSKMNIGTNADQKAILALKKSKNYQLACAKHFEVMHPQAATVPDVKLDGVGNHPNAWFAASAAYHKTKSGGSAETTATTTASATDKIMNAAAKVTPIKAEGTLH